MGAAQQEHQIAQYDEEILCVDAQLKRLADAIDGKRDDIRWVVTADHGEEFWERAWVMPIRYTVNNYTFH